MNNVEFNHYHNLKLCDSHWHLSMPHALQDTVRTFREMMAYFVLDRVGLTPGPFNFVEISKNRDAWTTFFKTYRKRIFFGTDTYNTLMEGDDLTKYEAPHVRGNLVRHALEKNAEDAFDIPLGKVIPLNLEDDVLSDIYFGNHKRLHPHPRPLNRELIAEQAEILLCDLKSGKEKLWIEEEQKLETENAAVVLSHFKK